MRDLILFFKCQIDTKKLVIGNRHSPRLTPQQMFTPHVVQPRVINKPTFWHSLLMGGDFKMEHLSWNGPINIISEISRCSKANSHINKWPSHWLKSHQDLHINLSNPSCSALSTSPLFMHVHSVFQTFINLPGLSLTAFRPSETEAAHGSRVLSYIGVWTFLLIVCFTSYMCVWGVF